MKRSAATEPGLIERVFGLPKEPAKAPRIKAPKQTAAEPPAPAPEEQEVLAVPGFPIDRIDLAENARTDICQEALAELSLSLDQHGMIEPVVLTRGERGRYRLVAGYRRLEAARRAGWTEVPAVLHPVSGEREIRLVQLVENLQRQDLSPIEEAKALEDMGFSDDELAERVGKSRPWVANRRRLLKLPETVKAMLAAREITVDDGLALLTVTDPIDCIARAGAIRDGRLKAKDLRALARAKNGAGAKGGETPVLTKTDEAPDSPEWREAECMVIEEMLRPSPPAQPDQRAPVPVGNQQQAPEDAPASNAHQTAPDPPPYWIRERKRWASQVMKAVEKRRREEGALSRDPKATAVIVQRVLSGTPLSSVHRMLNRWAKEFPLPLPLLKGEMDRPAEELFGLLATMPPEDQLQLAFWALIQEEVDECEGSGQRPRRGPWYAGMEVEG